MGESTPARYQAIEEYLASLCRTQSPGTLLPSETELSARFGVSRMTARHAVQNLAQAGLVDRRRGSGTFVAAPPLHRQDGVLLSFTEDMARRGMSVSSRLLSAELTTAPDDAVALGLAPTAMVVRIDRVRFADGLPMARERVVLPGEFARVLESDLEAGSLHEALRLLGRRMNRASGHVTARMANADEARLLQLSPPAAMLVEWRTIYDDQDRKVERTETAYVGTRWVMDTGSFVVSSLSAHSAAPSAPATVPSAAGTTGSSDGRRGVRRRSSPRKGSSSQSPA